MLTYIKYLTHISVFTRPLFYARDQLQMKILPIELSISALARSVPLSSVLQTGLMFEEKFYALSFQLRYSVFQKFRQ